MTTYVLVHGAWQDGESWDRVRPELEALGHAVHTPTAGGLRPGDSADVGTEDACQPIIDYILEHKLIDFVLVGHSWGGVLIAKIAEALSDRIRRLVFQSAFVLLDGQAVLDNIPPFFPPALQANAEERGDGTVMLPFEVWRDGFMNDATIDLAREVYSHLRPQPLRTFTEPVDLKRFFELPLPKSYLNATEDNGLLQGEWGWHPRMSNRLGYFRLVQMPGGHEVMYTSPKLLATKIVEAGRD
ncbi:alpha/beta hydrolase family protein [Sinomonas sp. JGH33]|uniref:Alpha/beta hydrolase family protein n=1 Tax=Sinomonas terricola TaxID=3110330 RepID=A0ABU5T9E1_9MICC|nr:alpha/beta hydrolase family protein [Sinomonas sp. JGH33]MEA5456298.1 alpha/beta hydrolase family protein [Sinomonas sp. JGH33]